jgi:NAD(P)-dependent dehydrogenase (short-subunit alcohol dehydrogenase family)
MGFLLSPFGVDAGLGKKLRPLLRGVGRNMGECQSAVAEATEAFGKIDILVNCGSQGE